jgi:hypothetical protein
MSRHFADSTKLMDGDDSADDRVVFNRYVSG